jgi:hypothetical protein
MPLEPAERIAELLRRRHEQVGPVQAEISRWHEIDDRLGELAQALDELRRSPALTADDAPGLAIPELTEISVDIAATIDAYSAVAARFSRETVNIGVSGSARVGKSTLLQSISGLTDEQIPTGRTIPVTAVRSRIYHSTRPSAAVLRMHSPESFLAEVISPYHRALAFDRAPATLQEFRRWSYPDSRDVEAMASGDVGLLSRLREMQDALWSYENDLTGGATTIDLADLRPYVAYPTSAERDAGTRLAHRYLAVRDARIDCEFPKTDVDKLGIVDLPGLGEVAADAEDHHLAGLRHDVDVVLLVKRASESIAFWGKSDAQAINLLDQARGAIRNRGDFVYIVVNARPEDAELSTALRAHIVQQVNDGVEGRYFRILTADAADPDSVRRDILGPVLQALAERLPVMDEEFLAGAASQAEAVRSRIAGLQERLSGALSRSRSMGESGSENLSERARDLRVTLMEALKRLVEELRIQATTEGDDPVYVKAIDERYLEVMEWIAGGFGDGKDAWCRRAVQQFGLDYNNSGPYTVTQLNKIRVQIGNGFAKLNDYFSRRVEEARRQVGVILRDNLGPLLAEVDPAATSGGTDLLKRAVEIFDEPNPPCDSLSEACGFLIDLRLEYRTQFHPQVRELLHEVTGERPDPGTGDLRPVITVPANAAGALALYEFCTDTAEHAAHEIRKELLAVQVTPLMVIYAAVEQFEDSFIHSGKAERDFGRLSSAYSDVLWPDAFAGLTEANAHYSKVKRLMTNLTGLLA